MDAGGLKGAGVARGTLICRMLHRNAGFAERRRQRFGRKQMPAGAAGGDQHAAIFAVFLRRHFTSVTRSRWPRNRPSGDSGSEVQAGLPA